MIDIDNGKFDLQKSFKKEWTRLKQIAELTIYHCQKKYKIICKAYEEFCAENKWLPRCNHIQSLSEN